jgi:hypothetical protein
VYSNMHGAGRDMEITAGVFHNVCEKYLSGVRGGTFTFLKFLMN